MAKTLETLGGDHIRECVKKAVALARKSKDTVTFEFNGSTYHAEPTDSYETARVRAEAVLGIPILTASDEQAEAARRIEETATADAKAIADAKVPTEKELREADVPWLKTQGELTAYIAALVDRPHDYGTCVYAMSMASVAAFQYVSGVLGVTVFQAACADMDILTRTRHMKGPFMILNGADMLYPQYDLRQQVDEFIEKSSGWAADEATKNLAESGRAHPGVRAHWERLKAGK